MKFILIPAIIWILSQSIKFVVRLMSRTTNVLGKASWVYQWAGGAPSTHTAVLIGALYLTWHDYGLNSIFGFCLVVTLLLIYNLLEDRKKQELVEHAWAKSRLRAVISVFKDGKLLDISGHTYFEIIAGLVFGLFCSIVLNNIL